MTNLIDRLITLISPVRTVPAGLYHFQSPPQDARNYRLHLRIEPDGNGVLLVNASTVLHLNQTAAEYAFYLVKNLAPDIAGRRMARHYDIPEPNARQDYLDFIERIQTLINTPDLDPVTFLDFDRRKPFAQRITAPYRLDCAITYDLALNTSADFTPSDRVKKELSTDEWKSILDKAWKAGIPHIVFTGGEPTLREDLVEMVAHAEKNGQITGLLTDGLKFSEDAYREKLLQTGLDHVMILLNQDNPKAWEAVEESLVEDLSVAVHLTLFPENKQKFEEMLKRLSNMGVNRVSLSASESTLSQALDGARNQAAFLGLDLVWDLPVPYSAFNPVSLETGSRNQQSPAGRAWLYVEPDGDVLPEQGVNQVMGNLLNDPWEKIWKPS